LNFSVSSPETAVTTPSPLETLVEEKPSIYAPSILPTLVEENMAATNPAQDRAAFDNYYWGLRGNPRLLGRSSTEAWTLPMVEDLDFNGERKADRKVVLVIGPHPLREKLRHGLRDKVLQVLATMDPCRWISVDYIRLGYDKIVPTNNPVMVWVTVEENTVREVEAQRIVDALTQECRR
jgi:hypothetical protein